MGNHTVCIYATSKTNEKTTNIIKFFENQDVNSISVELIKDLNRSKIIEIVQKSSDGMEPLLRNKTLMEIKDFFIFSELTFNDAIGKIELNPGKYLKDNIIIIDNKLFIGFQLEKIGAAFPSMS